MTIWYISCAKYKAKRYLEEKIAWFFYVFDISKAYLWQTFKIEKYQYIRIIKNNESASVLRSQFWHQYYISWILTFWLSPGFSKLCYIPIQSIFCTKRKKFELWLDIDEDWFWWSFNVRNINFDHQQGFFDVNLKYF